MKIPYTIGLIGEAGDQIAVKVSQKDHVEWISDVLLARMQTDLHRSLAIFPKWLGAFYKRILKWLGSFERSAY